MKIFLGGDHAGFEMKRKLIDFLNQKGGYEVVDFGPFGFNPADDYSDFVSQVAKAVENEFESSRGIIIGGSGQGEAICANRFKKIRAVVFYGGNLEIIKLSREHNDANILSLGARFINLDEAKLAVETWLNTDFSKVERHVRRLKKIEEMAR